MAAPAPAINQVMQQFVEPEILLGDVKVYDYTGGRAVVSFNKDEAEKCKSTAYSILFDNKQLTLLPFACPCPHKHFFLLVRSLTITFKMVREGRFVHIKETDPDAESNFYIDVAQLREAAEGIIYSYMPINIGKELSERKIAVFKEENPQYQPLVIGYNRHGVGAFCYEMRKGKHVNDLVRHFLFCWASPQDEKLKAIWGDSLVNHLEALYRGVKIVTQGPFMRFEVCLQRQRTNTVASLGFNNEACSLLDANEL